jgi:NTE family protein
MPESAPFSPTPASFLGGLFAPEPDGSPPPHVTELSLAGGRTLYEAGSAADHIFLVRAGRLGVTRRGERDGPLFLGVVRPGEIVGEMAALAGTPHSATVSALRDTELWSMPRELFLETAQHDPRVMTELARVILARARHGPQPSAVGEPRVFSLLSLSPRLDVRALADAVARHVRYLGLRAIALGAEAIDQPRAWFSAVEAEHDVVLLAADEAVGAWRDSCARQADRVFLVAHADDPPRPDARAFGLEPLRRHRLVDLLLVRPRSRRDPYNGRIWREAAGATGLFHVRQGGREDLRRLARVVSGRSVGLVLSGGSAPAYSHMGAIRALREAGGPVDFVGGASMGAVVGAGLAMGWDEVEATARIRSAFVESNPLDDMAFRCWP